MSESAKSDLNTVHDIIQKATAQKRWQLFEHEAKKLVELYGITIGRHNVVSSCNEAIQAASSLGYPVVLKIISPDISHKTDVGGVMAGIKDADGIKMAFEEILRNVKVKRPDARIQGIFVEEMASLSTEVIVGGIRDPQFGPAVMFGLGGVFVEVFKDVSFRIAPVEEFEAFDMISDIKGATLLKGFRNTRPLDIPALAQTIIQVSHMMTSLDEIKEIDLNPVFVYPKGVKAVDARIILS